MEEVEIYQWNISLKTKYPKPIFLVEEILVSQLDGWYLVPRSQN